jgi:hypothetical protein
MMGSDGEGPVYNGLTFPPKLGGGPYKKKKK